MTSPDELLKRLEEIYKTFGEFCHKRGSISEADTRHQIIDRILHEVLLWPRHHVKCEERTDVGVMDYTLYPSSRPLVVVEAKKAGETWYIPHSKLQRKVYELSGVIRKHTDIAAAIDQVQAYCNAQGIYYGKQINVLYSRLRATSK